MKKLLIVGGAIIFIAIVATIFYFQQRSGLSDEQIKNTSLCADKKCKECVKNGGRIIEPVGFPGDYQCELKAKDFGKTCTLDNECDKNNCIYQTVDSANGQCDDYGAMGRAWFCHRPQSSDKVVCEGELN